MNQGNAGSVYPRGACGVVQLASASSRVRVATPGRGQRRRIAGDAATQGQQRASSVTQRTASAARVRKASEKVLGSMSTCLHRDGLIGGVEAHSVPLCAPPQPAAPGSRCARAVARGVAQRDEAPRAAGRPPVARASLEPEKGRGHMSQRCVRARILRVAGAACARVHWNAAAAVQGCLLQLCALTRAVRRPARSSRR